MTAHKNKAITGNEIKVLQNIDSKSLLAIVAKIKETFQAQEKINEDIKLKFEKINSESFFRKARGGLQYMQKIKKHTMESASG